ncbi:hypothetical protein [Neptunitalea lumnitzerae]|uniref:Uncharacterized protein n=1 Tax=Neptunitalea lumnitzerae TaxID=2965509 RepID=A0ABQ5MI09_9FLAO|nr:hypothetical protein [Neptunitalea sp. Y10]GLB48567.1 hypothetical protein Y10_09350 [Neptunitalea sp. Y10]
MTQTLPCPVCKSTIYFEPTQLLQGVGFQCTNCFSEVKISGQSLDQAKKLYDDFKRMKTEVLNAKK